MYMPRHHLYPSNSQILHHLVMELFVIAPQSEKEEDSFFSLVPCGPVYKYGWVLATQWKQIFQSHPDYKTLVLIAWSDLPEDVWCIVTSDTILHSFFGTIVLDPSQYAAIAQIDEELFAKHAKWVEAQLPFIRGYKHLDGVAPYIVNTTLPQEEINKILDAIMDQHGEEACYVFIQPDQWVEKFVEYVDRQKQE
jgi:AmmeMemoRadiSam system protein B